MAEMNETTIAGVLSQEFVFSHDGRDKKFYSSEVSVLRKSGVEDIVIVIAEESMVKGLFKNGDKIKVRGKLHTPLVRRRGRVYLFAKFISIDETKDNKYPTRDNNVVHLEGKLKDKPFCQKTSLRNTDIAEFMACVPRENGRIDYIPCVAWGKMARLLGACEKDVKVRLQGRLQSRTFFKASFPGSPLGEYRTINEVAIKKIEIIA